MNVLSYAHPQLFKVFKQLIYVWHGCEMQFERFYHLNDSVVGSFPHLHHMISETFPKSGETSVVVTVWMCCHMPILNCSRCSNTLYIYDMDMGCSLKGSTVSTIVWNAVWKVLQSQRFRSGIISTLTSSRISVNSPKSGDMSVVVTVYESAVICPSTTV